MLIGLKPYTISYKAFASSRILWLEMVGASPDSTLFF